MNKKYSLPFLVFVAAILMVTACDLQTEPRQSVSPDVALGDINGVEATLTSVYYRLQRPPRYGRHFLLAPDVLADHTEMHPQPSGRYRAQFDNTPGAHVDGGLWGNAYRSINEANIVIESLEEVEAPQAQKDRLRGEALFMRALAYFDLARVYGYEPGQEVDGWDLAVPIRTEAVRDADDADFRPRNTNREVYDQIVSDLEQAAALLEGNDRGVYYANYAAVNALLARVHLYQGQWSDAIDHADEAMSRTSATLVSGGSFASAPPDPIGTDDFVDELGSVSNIFTEHPNPESIFELQYDPDTESVGSNEAPVAILTPQTWFDILPSEDLLSLYQEDDVRNNLYTEYVDGYPMILKYTQSAGSATDYHEVIRYPEMLLIKAEAYLELDNEPEALNNLHMLQEARNMEPADVSGYQAIMEEIMDERSRELAYEGHRFFDLKRKGWDIRKPDGMAPIPYTDYRVLAELPSGQVDNNPEMVQNPGY